MPDDLAVKVGEALVRRGWRLAVAESCTGGLVSKLLTDVPGSSRYFAGAVCAYSNEAKAKLLGVSEVSLSGCGAVSKEVAAELAKGALERFSVDIAIGITGIAGPEGCTQEKPVGLVFVAVATRSASDVQQHVFEGDREAVRTRAARTALKFLLDKVNSV